MFEGPITFSFILDSFLIGAGVGLILCIIFWRKL